MGILGQKKKGTGTFIRVTPSVHQHGRVNLTSYCLKKRDVMSSLALRSSKAFFKPGSANYRAWQTETEYSSVLLDAAITEDVPFHLFETGRRNGYSVQALGSKWASIKVQGKTIKMKQPTITTFRDERCVQISVERTWASWPAEDPRLLKEDFFYVVWSTLQADSYVITEESTADTDRVVDAGQLVGAAATIAGSAVTGGTAMAILPAVQAAATQVPLKAEVHQHFNKKAEGHMAKSSVIAYELRKVVRKGKRWELGGFYKPTDDERFDFD